ncbi:peptidoglycan DD-metalloendopeptidase family protein [Niveispirillum sp. BGYR6]|uniref:peptidoglycan DD-metalloendopeptidase family protein n=1 Tax=Niveispirillum sp. BGYR6 TaxID=2971249 RepID=UPI0022B983A8|nr:peptidoglycan DD-metalloendopeptidase family protein [Niveispirillum sp. BGYR6]MDG5493399.1 peptidoglycan DD-metalloendopeptidase family protein [Niveispirillum sp. BGYR6]
MRLATTIAVPLLALGLLSGCSTGGDAPHAAPPPPPANAIFVSRGDTVQTIAAQYHVSAQDLISLNGLAPPYTLHPGQRLNLPTPRTYQVKAGDTVYGIARQMNVDMAEIIRLNGLQPPYMVRVGQQLQMPGGGGGAPAQVASSVNPAPAPARKPDMPPATSSAPPARAPRPSVEAVPLDPPAPAAAKPVTPAPVRPTVTAPVATSTAPAAGKRGVEAETLAPPPAAPVPHASNGNGTASNATAPVLPANRQPVPVTPAPVVPATPAPVPSQAPTPAPQVATATPLAKPDEAPPPRTAARFMWPLRGEIISTYGAKPGGLRNDGINIAASQGTAVAAAEAGIVAYAGNQLKSFGNLVLIRHDGGWVTVYAHLADIGVQQGQRVTRGQSIGTVGQTGNVRFPQLHFAVRKGDQVVDPMGQLEK